MCFYTLIYIYRMYSIPKRGTDIDRVLSITKYYCFRFPYYYLVFTLIFFLCNSEFIIMSEFNKNIFSSKMFITLH